VGPALELLGLTPAEARIAALVGGGESPREAADALGVTYNTVRSSLKLVFDKLGVGRQSELARVVARLAG
jgi:DNA-binding CsgD family transcriptional regulator